MLSVYVSDLDHIETRSLVAACESLRRGMTSDGKNASTPTPREIAGRARALEREARKENERRSEPLIPLEEAKRLLAELESDNPPSNLFERTGYVLRQRALRQRVQLGEQRGVVVRDTG